MAAAAEALNKWDDGRACRGEVGYPLPSFGVQGYNPREICEDIGSNLCNLVHFGVKNKHLNRNIQTLTNYQLINYDALTTDFG